MILFEEYLYNKYVMSMKINYQDSNVIVKKNYATIKFVDEAKTAEDKTGDNPKNRTIYSKIFLTYSGMIVNPLTDIRFLQLPNRNNLRNVNAFIEVPGGTDLIYEPQMNKSNEFNYCAPYETGSTQLQEVLGGQPLPNFASYGFFPRTLNSKSFDYKKFIPNQTTPTIRGDGDAMDVLLFGQASGTVAREIAEVVQVRVLSCVIGVEKNPPNPDTFEAVCIAISNDDPRYDGINTMIAWQDAATAVANSPQDPKYILKQSYDYCVGSLNVLFGMPQGQNVVFNSTTFTRDLIQLQLNLFLQENQ